MEIAGTFSELRPAPTVTVNYPSVAPAISSNGQDAEAYSQQYLIG
jgi:hypothetical protein